MDKKKQEYLQRGLPFIRPDGRPCRCRECEDARRLGLGTDLPLSRKREDILFAAPDWKPQAGMDE